MKPTIVIWGALGAGVIAALALLQVIGNPHQPAATSQLELTQKREEAPSSEQVELERCRRMAQPDDACFDLWEANRRHFLGLDKPQVKDE